MMRVALVSLLALSTMCAACDRLSDIGRAPALSNISDPGLAPEARVVSMPMPEPTMVEQTPSSLWRTGSREFFRDPRAKQVGDLLTVVINIADQAKLNNETQRERTNAETAAAPSFFGLEKVLPKDTDPASLVDMSSGGSSKGSGTIERNETIAMRVAGVVTRVLPNGNFVIAGRQEVRVNFELRELRVAGVIRPEDISNTNTIDYDKIAEARITYGGRGQITDVQQPRYGQQALDIVLPF